MTMDSQRREIRQGGFFVRDGWFEEVGPTDSLPKQADRVLDLEGHVVLPGLVNTHHHFYQTLTRALPAAQDASLFRWLQILYPIWARMGPEEVRLSTQLALAELALSGCTTAADHLYIFPNGCKLDDEIEAASQVGLRLHAARGSMSLGESQGGLPPDQVVETEEVILRDSQRLIERYHDPDPGSKLQIILAPCSPFSVTADLMRASAQMARQYGVRLHTHLAETMDEERFCIEQFGQRPLAYAESLNWSGEDVWFAHCVHINPVEIERMAEQGIGVAHCPSSNMRLASGIAPVGAYLAAGVAVSLGVDGSASNDGSHLLAEARQALLLSRVGEAMEAKEGRGPALLSARAALEMATLGGAAVLGREDIGAIETGRCADFVAVDLERVSLAGALHDPIAATVFCHPPCVDYNYVHGVPVVEEGRLLTLELKPLVRAHNRAAQALTEG
jgi:cytosine/adenosine deaminase-related metal-dependent hydrolase